MKASFTGRLAFAAILALTLTQVRAQDAQPAYQQAPPDPAAIARAGTNIVANAEVAAMFGAGKVEERITGNVSVAMRSTPEGEKGGYLEVDGFNIVFTGVSQEAFGQKADAKNPLGVLGFALQRGGKHRLKYDAKSGRASGELRMVMDASYFAQFAQPQADDKNDLFVTPTVPVTVSVEVNLGRGSQERLGELRNSTGSLNVKLAGKETRLVEGKLVVPAFKLSFLKPAVFDWELAPIFFFEVAQRLCIQPVRLLQIRWFPWPFWFQYSGQGLAFGEPGLREQWRKVDITFNIRDWKTIYSPAHWEFSASEATALRSQVEDDDCIEVFFTNSFDPDDQWGGGATFGSGTASSQVISSDDNARHGIDLTHLAHEFGHVLDLPHPGGGGSSTGTLMCPSGFKRDNPRVNSQENGDLANNPLLTFSLKLITPGPDCLDSADCGACPF